MLKIAVCIASDELQKKYEKYINIALEKHDVGATVDYYQSEKELLFEWGDVRRHADLVFLDMDNRNGMKVATELKENKVETNIVFITQNEERAFEAFDAHVLYCVVMDCMDEEAQSRVVEEAILKAETRVGHYIIFANRHQECKVFLKDIHYFEVVNHQITMYYQERGGEEQKFEFSGSIKKIANGLSQKGFLYPHRAYVIAESYVKQMTKGELILMNDLRVTIGRNKRQEVREAMQAIF